MLVTLISLAISLAAASEGVRLARVDLLSLDPGTWINYELPDLTGAPARAGLRFLTQIKPVIALPYPGLSVGASIVSQSLHYERSLGLAPGLAVGAALQTAWLLPRGGYVDVSVTRGRLRAGVGVDALSSATWSHLDWSHWVVLPGVSLGIMLGESH